MNRFQSILDGVADSVFDELRRLYPQLPAGMHWTIDHGALVASDGRERYEFTFEQGDPASEAFLLLLNHLPILVQVLGTRRHA